MVLFLFFNNAVHKLTTQPAPFFFRNVHLETPYPIERSPDQLHYTYLDTFGRPVLVATKKNLVEQHIQDMVVRFTGDAI